jgi:hypothetical protein
MKIPHASLETSERWLACYIPRELEIEPIAATCFLPSRVLSPQLNGQNGTTLSIARSATGT